MNSLIATEVHIVSDLHHKQRLDTTLQEYIQNFNNLMEKAMGTDPVNITNRVIIFLFVKNLHNKDIRRWSSWHKDHQYVSRCI